MKYRRLLLIFLSLTLCLSLFACADKGEDNESVSTDTEEQTEPKDPYLSLYEGEKGVKVIYSPSASSEVLDIATKLARSLGRMGIATHEAEAAINNDPNTVEILVDRTGYEESDAAYADIGYGEGIVSVIGNKVTIAGLDTKSLEKAVDMLLHAVDKHKNTDGGLRIPRDYKEVGISNETVAALPIMDGATPKAMTGVGDGGYMLTFDGVNKANVDAYLEKLTADGYSKYVENIIENNSFYIYIKEQKVLNVAYLENREEARIIIEPKTNAPLDLMIKDESYVKGDKAVTLTQLGLAYASDSQIAEYYTSGMSYIMRLDDGSFIVIDGGYDKQGDADRLYETMKLQAGSDNVTVAAWIFTHAHSDHVEVFPKFAASYSDKVEIERFIYNIPGADQKGTHSDSSAKLISALDKYYKSVPRIKAHAGQKLYIRSVEVEMLYTLELSNAALKNYNNTSLVFRINAEGKQIMITGDYSESSPTLLALYTEKTLKSDIMQVAHHGISDGNLKLNSTIAPEYALWPVVALQLKTYWNSNPTSIDLTGYLFNQYFINMDDDHVFVAGDDVVVMTLAGDITATVYDNFDNYVANTPN